MAFVRMRARPIVSPSGFDQSSGTWSVAHCHSSPGAGASEVALQRPQSSAAFPPLPSSFFAPSSDGPAPLHPAVSSAAAAVRAAHRVNRVMCHFPLAGRPLRAANGVPAMVGSPGVRRWRPVENPLSCAFAWAGSAFPHDQGQTVPAGGTVPSSR